MVQPRSAFASQLGQQLGNVVALCVLLQVTLHHRIAECSIDSSFDQGGVAVPKSMNSDPGNHIQLYTAVCQLDKRTVTNPASEIRKVQFAAANLSELVQHLLIRLSQFGIRRTDPTQIRLMLCDCSKDQLFGFGQSRVIGQLRRNKLGS